MSDTTPLRPCAWALLTMASVFTLVLTVPPRADGLPFRMAQVLYADERIPACFCRPCCRSSVCFPLYKLCLLIFQFNLGAALIFCIS